MKEKIMFFNLLAKLNEFVDTMEVDLWRTITAGWRVDDAVEFVNSVWKKKAPEILERTRSKTELRNYEEMMNLAYEIATIWDLPRAVSFCTEMTKAWSIEEKGNFIVSLYERHIDEALLMTSEPDINFIARIMESYTNGTLEISLFLLDKRLVGESKA
jgi:hypothetical protein